MKKKFLTIVGVAAFAVAAFNINAGLKSNTDTDLVLLNVEVLSHGEWISAQCGVDCYWEWCGGFWIGDTFAYLQECWD